MKKDADPLYSDSLPAINARIEELKTTYSDIVTKLIRYYIQNVSEDALNRYKQVDDLKYFNEKDFSDYTDDKMWGTHYYDTLEVRSSTLHKMISSKIAYGTGLFQAQREETTNRP